MVDDILKTSELAALLRCSPATVRRAVQRGMPCMRVGRTLRFSKAAVLKWLSPTAVGRTLRRLREAAGLDVEQLAERAKVRSEFLAGIENGLVDHSAIHASELQPVVNALGYQLSEFFGEVERR
jgi:excisionase family DNA binding protein